MKGYCLIEYATLKEAKRAIEEMDDQEFMEQNLQVDWAFLKGVHCETYCVGTLNSFVQRSVNMPCTPGAMTSRKTRR